MQFFFLQKTRYQNSLQTDVYASDIQTIMYAPFKSFLRTHPDFLAPVPKAPCTMWREQVPLSTSEW